MAGSCALTDAMIEDLKAVKLPREAWPPGKDRVRRARDFAWDGPSQDFAERKVFLDHKKEIKARQVLYEHWAPPCETFTQALAQYKMRFAGRPYGEGWTPEENPRAEKLDRHTQIAINVCGEARTKHEVGDFFSIEHIWPTEMVNLSCYEELIGLPGVFIVIFDNCRYKKEYRHRQCLITNAPWLMWLSKDCPGVPEHRHEGQIGFGAKFRTAEIAAYPEALVRAWAKIFADFVRGLQAQTLCPWCAHLHGGGKPERTGSQLEDVVMVDRSVVRASWEFDALEPAGDHLGAQMAQLFKEETGVDGTGAYGELISTKAILEQSGVLHENGVILRLDVRPSDDVPASARWCSDPSVSSGDSQSCSRDGAPVAIARIGIGDEGYSERVAFTACYYDDLGYPSLFVRNVNNYKNAGKKERQAANLDKLKEEVEKAKQAHLDKKDKYPDAKSRRSPEFLAELWRIGQEELEPLDPPDDLWTSDADKDAKAAKPRKGAEPIRRRIGGTNEEAKKYFDECVAPFGDVHWIDGCKAPTIRDHKIHMEALPNAKPIAMQPIPLSPFDDIRVDYHLWENIHLGKMRKIDPLKEGLPEWSTAVFVVDQDAKGLLGRMVCACGPVNSQMMTATFPAADVIRAWEIAAGCAHHTLIDAIWGYTQFKLDVETSDGIYEWLRMPFGPAPAPAMMQSYVYESFANLKNPITGKPFCTPCMDDISCSNKTLKEHIASLIVLFEVSRKKGFEFKFKKGQMNQAEIEFWGSICSGEGRKPNPKKVKQLMHWPEPKDQADLTSFCAFVNYLREFMPADWVQYERCFSPLRKKDGKTNFEKLWATCKGKVYDKEGKEHVITCSEAFRKIRGMLNTHAILHHPDFLAAQDPTKSGRPFEMFVDASDYGWCGTLCQRLTPHGAPKIIAMSSKAFDSTQLRWSAMERELYALWQAVIGMERYIRGLLCFVYIDHKNNLFTKSMLDNRRIAKKVSNWALELQCFNIVRVWIRGEANILSDAPSRAPWECELAKHLPIPTDPVSQLIKDMYELPDDVARKYEEVARKLPAFETIPRNDDKGLKLDDVVHQPDGDDGAQTPHFGAKKVDILEAKPLTGRDDFSILEADYGVWLGPIGIVEDADFTGEYPRWPQALSLAVKPTKVLPEESVIETAIPLDPKHHPISLRLWTATGGQRYWRVYWPAKVKFSDGTHTQTKFFSFKDYPS